MYYTAAMPDALEPSNVVSTLYDSGRFAELLDYCTMRLEKDPSETLSLQNGALACLHLGRYEEAAEFCSKVLDADGGDAYALRNMVYALENLHRYADVLERCESMLKTDPRDIWTINSAGLALAEMGRYAEAAEYFERATKLDPHNTTALMNGALSLERTGQTRRAISHYDAALRLDPSMREAAEARARAYHTLGMEDEAFLAAQGIRDNDMARIIRQARRNRCTLLHQLCLEEMDRYQDADPHADNPFRPDRRTKTGA